MENVEDSDSDDMNTSGNMDFVIDTVGDTNKIHKDGNDETGGTAINSNTSTDKDNRISELFKGFDHIFETPNLAKITEIKTESKNPLVKQTLESLGVNENGSLKKNYYNFRKKVASKTDKIDVKKVLEHSVITPEFEKLHVVPPVDVSEKKLKQQRQKERSLTKGSKWYGLPATELTDEVKRDLEVLQMRSVLDPKHFYKKNDLKVLPKYFQIGKVMDSPLDFYNDRIPKKQRKKTLVDELLADAEFNKYNKRKYKEIIEEKQKTHYKAWRQAKRLKKKK